MENRRREIAPVLLAALAVTSLSFSAVIAIGLNRPTKQRLAATPFEPPRRSNEPIIWHVAELPPLLASTPTAEASTPPLSVLVSSSIDHHVAEPIQLKPLTPASFCVLLPSEPRWQAGDRMPAVVTPGIRSAWSLAGFDTLAAVKGAGRFWTAASQAGTSRGYRVALRAWVNTSSSAKVRAPQLIIARPVTPAIPLRIAEYLNDSPRGGDFPVPSVLAEQLDRVAVVDRHEAWAWSSAYRLRTLMAAQSDEAVAHRALDALADAASEAVVIAGETADPAEATELRRAAYALSRRVATWRAEQTRVLAIASDPAGQLEAARWAMAMPAYGPRPGLLLSEQTAQENREHKVLRVARRLEAYEQRPSSRLAMLLAEDAARLGSAGGEEGRALATAIEQNYRNANLRVAIAAELVERMIPNPEPIVSPIRDRIAGTPVTGRSTTETEIAVRLAPDESAWRIGLEATGVVTSRTQSRGGPAVLSSKGSTSFQAKKLVVLTTDGLRVAPTVADSHTMSQRLVGLSTNYDRVPLLGNYVRSAARSEYSRLRARAKAETRVKVERQVGRALDERVDQQLGQIENRFAQNVTARAESLGLAIEPIEMRTTGSRLISRLRIAGDNQLAAHTPRMRAPSDSLLSFQMHESTLNNAIEGLGLAGETLDSEALRTRLAERLGLSTKQTEPGEQAVFRFAKEDPVRLTFKEGQVKLTLKLDEIAVRGRRHRNFRVHAFYRPVAEGLTAMLVQDGTPHIEGRLRTGARIHLHGVMGKVLGENARVPLVQLRQNTPERFSVALEGLATNQFVIEDGWLGIAIGPPRGPGSMAARVGTYVR